ncbi:hypothetical protein PDJAM_G00081540 [Pangasius djambal]|uniref:Uncharacterized protein n=1 Tax=Pangasius djambal TaxID=1691987 RepID=A0ACC5Z549_9TELE|nr:hypothetical protein [Pangasius djambal]
MWMVWKCLFCGEFLHQHEQRLISTTNKLSSILQEVIIYFVEHISKARRKMQIPLKVGYCFSELF